jgi:hypothetical protein
MVKIQVTKYIFVTDFQHVDEYTIG